MYEGERRYRGTPCDRGTADHAWTVRRDGGGTYRVAFGPFGLRSCECPAWKFRKKCSHVEAARLFLPQSEGSS